MNEALLQTIWKHRLLARQEFVGAQGESIRVISVGEHNTDSGPDFFNARVSINDIVLAGNVEVHIKTSDWLRHRHQYDKSYNNLVLHVVYEHDVSLRQNEEHRVSVLELKPLIRPSLIEAYRELEFSRQTIPCGRSLKAMPAEDWKRWLNRLVVQRLERKANGIEQVCRYANGDLEETLYVLLCRHFGFKVNNDVFELLARSLPYKTIRLYADNVLRIEALLFGMAGFLDEPLGEAYPKLLQNEFELLKHKHRLIPLNPELWKFSKIRPANFPTIRLAQLAQIFHKHRSLYHLLEELPPIAKLREFFSARPGSYWETHFRFGAATEASAKTLGNSALDSLMINTVVPFLFFRSTRTGHQPSRHYALALLQQLDAEQNSKTRAFSTLGVNGQQALESQGQIELYEHFCSKKACLRCSVAEFLLKASS